MKKYSGLLVFLLVAAVAGCSAPPAGEGVHDDFEAGEYEIDELDPGDIASLLSADGPVLLVFWTTRCPGCVRAIPLINDFYRTYGGEVEVLGINVGESREAVERFAAARGVRYRIGLDRRGEIARSYNVAGVPTYVLIMPGQEIVYSGHSFEEMLGRSGI